MMIFNYINFKGVMNKKTNIFF